MPLPRFDRLPAADRESILAVAREHFARDGREASFNQIIADAGISKTSAYHYFDGKDDLLSAVVAESVSALSSALGAWLPASDAPTLWRQIADGTATLLSWLRRNPEHRAVLALGSPDSGAEWIAHALENARELGLVVPPRGPDLILEATMGVVAALDHWAVTETGVDADGVSGTVIDLLARLWGARQP